MTVSIRTVQWPGNYFLDHDPNNKISRKTRYFMLGAVRPILVPAEMFASREKELICFICDEKLLQEMVVERELSCVLG